MGIFSNTSLGNLFNKGNSKVEFSSKLSNVKMNENQYYDTIDYGSNSESLIEDVGDTALSLVATGAVVYTSTVSGLGNIYESIVDGTAWCGGKIVSGASWAVAKISGLFDDDIEKNIMSWREDFNTDIKESIAYDMIDEFNEFLYEDTPLGNFINNKSYIKYDSDIAKKITNISEAGYEFAIATAATIATGGAAAPLILGGLYGLGDTAQKTYQKSLESTVSGEIGIAVSGLLEAFNWYAEGQLGSGAVQVGKLISENGIKNVLAMGRTFISGTLANIQNVGIKSTISNVLSKNNLMLAFKKSVKDIDNVIDSLGIIADNANDWIQGNKEFNFKSVTSAIFELGAAFGLNVLFDGILNYNSTGSDVGNVVNSKVSEELFKGNYNEYLISGNDVNFSNLSEQKLQKKIDRYNELLNMNNVDKKNISPIVKTQLEDVEKEFEFLEKELAMLVGNTSEADIDILSIMDEVETADLFNFENIDPTLDLNVTKELVSDIEKTLELDVTEKLQPKIEEMLELDVTEKLTDLNVTEKLTDLNVIDNNLDISEPNVVNTINNSARKFDTYEEFVDSYKGPTEAWEKTLSDREIQLIKNYIGESDKSSYATMNSVMRDIAINKENKTITLYHMWGQKTYTFDEYFNKFGETVDQFIVRTYDEAIALNNAISRSVFLEDTVVARGVDMNALRRFGITPSDSPEIIMSKLGSIYTDNGFMSSTPVAGGGFTYKDVNFVMTCKKGMAFADFSTWNAGEKEILLGLGSKFSVDKVEIINGKIMIYMTSIN